jgi:(p)ppGpp synthase/HD superfamily hydrolase
MELTDKFDQAIQFAHTLHHKQKRKGTDAPYISHLLGVCSLVLEHGGDEDQAIAALLHDSVEDQGENHIGGVEQLRKDIEYEFGANVLRIVNGCTDADTIPKPPWRERNEAYIAHIQNADSDIRFVSCCDKLHNARAILMDYLAIGDDLWERFNADKIEILWYYRSLADAFQEGGNSPLTEELDHVVSELEVVSE